MKTYMKKTLATTALAGVILSSAAGVYAMSDEEFKNAILKSIQAEENLSDSELAEVSEELADISRGDILASLQEEIRELDDEALKAEVQKEFDVLKGITDGEQFFTVIDGIYTTLDTYYIENYDEDDYEDYEYDFNEEKTEIIAELEEEKDYVDDETLKQEITDTILKITSITDEDEFFDALDVLFEKLDEHYGIEYDDEDWDDENWDEDFEYDFQDMKSEILEDIEAEKWDIKDSTLVTKIDGIIADLTATTDEDMFFDILDTLYEDEEIEAYYEAQGIDLITGDEFDDFDFEEEKPEIIEEIREEISEIDDPTLKSELESDLQKLEAEENENAFWNMLDTLFEKVDAHYGYDDEDYEAWDDEDQYEDNEDYDGDDFNDEDYDDSEDEDYFDDEWEDEDDSEQE